MAKNVDKRVSRGIDDNKDMNLWNRAIVEVRNKRKTKKNKYAATVITVYDEYSRSIDNNWYGPRVKPHRVANDTVEDEQNYRDDHYVDINDYVNDCVDDIIMGNSYMRKLEKIGKRTTEFSMPYNNSSGPHAEDRISVDRSAVDKNRDNVYRILLHTKWFDSWVERNIYVKKQEHMENRYFVLPRHNKRAKGKGKDIVENAE